MEVMGGRGISRGRIRVLTLWLAWSAALCLTGCATPLERGDFEQSYAHRPVLEAPVWNAVQRAALGKGPDWFVPLNRGPDALKMRLALIDSATRTIDAKYFIWHEDNTGSLLLERIIAAADRGVRVRLLIDDIELSEATDEWVAADAHPNISVRIYNPFAVRAKGAVGRFLDNLNDFSRVNHRMHNKGIVSDNVVAIIGGRNVADEYHGFGEVANFRDFDLMVGGEIVTSISSTFDHFWNSGWAYPAPAVEPDDRHDETALAVLRAHLADREIVLDPWLEAHRAGIHDWTTELVGFVETAVSGSARVLVDRPDVNDPDPAVQVTSQLRQVSDDTQREIVVVTPYLIPSPGTMDVVWELEGRNIEVIVLTNSLNTNNHVAAHVGYRRHRGDLLDAGVDIHEYRIDAKGREEYEARGYRAEHFTVHAKVIVFDRQRVFVGTFNVDPRSMYINTELGLLIDSPALAEEILEMVGVDFLPENAWHVVRDDDGRLTWVGHDRTMSREPSISGWRRFQAWLLGLFPMDNQL